MVPPMLAGPHVKHKPLPWAASLAHWLCAGVFSPNTALQKWAHWLLLCASTARGGAATRVPSTAPPSACSARRLEVPAAASVRARLSNGCSLMATPRITFSGVLWPHLSTPACLLMPTVAAGKLASLGRPIYF